VVSRKGVGGEKTERHKPERRRKSNLQEECGQVHELSDREFAALQESWPNTEEGKVKVADKRKQLEEFYFCFVKEKLKKNYYLFKDLDPKELYESNST
jgi:hypothetical protein